MDINILNTFIAVCEYAGFSAAAEKLGYTQSTVSSQIKQLERELGTVLFDRFYHHISLTREGEIALKYAREMLESHKKMISEIKQPETTEGEIRLAMSSAICNLYFKEDYLEFHKQFPKIRLIITESGTEQMFDMLEKNEVDLVFTLDSHIYEPNFEICAERQEEVHFIAAKENPLTKRKRLKLEDLKDQMFVLTEKNMSYRKILDQSLAEQSIAFHTVLELGNPFQICSIIKHSELLSFLPDFITKEAVENGSIEYLPVEKSETSVWTQLLIHKNKWKSPAIKTFIEYYRGIIAEKQHL